MSDEAERGTSERPSSPDSTVSDEAPVLDCRGLRCPAPVIELARYLADVELGALIGVASTDAAARVDVPAFCRMRGQEYAGESAATDGVPVYWVRRLA